MTGDPARLKRQAAEFAVQFIRPGMIVGLGTGSTSAHAVRRIAGLCAKGALRDLVVFATSNEVRRDAADLGLALLADDMPSEIDITIDGADEVDPELNLIKGGGGALLREKIAAQASRREIIIVDETKLSPRLGTIRPLPVEVLPCGWRSQARYLASLGGRPVLRTASEGVEFRTDQGNFILDCRFGPIAKPEELARKLDSRAGIIEHGLFLNLAHDVIVATRKEIRHLRPPQG